MHGLAQQFLDGSCCCDFAVTAWLHQVAHPLQLLEGSHYYGCVHLDWQICFDCGSFLQTTSAIDLTFFKRLLTADSCCLATWVTLHRYAWSHSLTSTSTVPAA